MGRHADIIGRVTDYAGQHWEVHERRETTHGFDVCIGWPEGEPRGRGGRGVATIITPALAHYLAHTRQRDIDLPIGLTAAKRLRRVLGIEWSWDDWWRDRAGDLRTMTLEAFAAKHQCSIGAASQRRAELTSARKITPLSKSSPNRAM